MGDREIKRNIEGQSSSFDFQMKKYRQKRENRGKEVIKKNVLEMKLSYTVGRNVKLYSYYGKQYGGSLKN